MKILLVTIGKTHTKYVVKGIEDYVGRLKRYVPFALVELPDVKTSKTTPEETQKSAEGDLILKQLAPSDFVVLLDERARVYICRILRLSSEDYGDGSQTDCVCCRWTVRIFESRI